MMKNKCVVILILVLVLCMGVFTAGCGNTQAAREDNNSLTIAVVTKDMYLDGAVKKFEELHPGVSVEVKEYTSKPLPSEGVLPDAGDIEKYVTAMNTQLMSGQGLRYHFIRRPALSDLCG